MRSNLLLLGWISVFISVKSYFLTRSPGLKLCGLKLKLNVRGWSVTSHCHWPVTSWSSLIGAVANHNVSSTGRSTVRPSKRFSEQRSFRCSLESLTSLTNFLRFFSSSVDVSKEWQGPWSWLTDIRFSIRKYLQQVKRLLVLQCTVRSPWCQS